MIIKTKLPGNSQSSLLVIAYFVALFKKNPSLCLHVLEVLFRNTADYFIEPQSSMLVSYL